MTSGYKRSRIDRCKNRHWDLASRLLLCLFMIALLAFIVSETASTAALWPLLETHWVMLCLAIAVYLTGHVLRAVRLAVILGNPAQSLRRIAGLHFYTAAVSLLLPWKLGDIYRIAELTRLSDRLSRSLVVVWIERFFDVAIFVLLAAALYVSNADAVGGIAPIVQLSFGFVAISFFAFILLPGNLNGLRMFVLRRYRGETAVQTQRLFINFQLFLSRAKVKFRTQLATLSTLSVLIWSCELLAFCLVLEGVFGSLTQIVHEMLFYLAGISSGRDPEILNNGAVARDAIPPLLLYLIATRSPLMLTGLIGGALYGRSLNQRRKI